MMACGASAWRHACVMRPEKQVPPFLRDEPPHAKTMQSKSMFMPLWPLLDNDLDDANRLCHHHWNMA